VGGSSGLVGMTANPCGAHQVGNHKPTKQPRRYTAELRVVGVPANRAKARRFCSARPVSADTRRSQTAMMRSVSLCEEFATTVGPAGGATSRAGRHTPSSPDSYNGLTQ
jgi:hypothetical protein